jgi:hypothetical protein
VTTRNEQRLVQLLEWVVAIEQAPVVAWVDAARERRPDADDEALARSAFGRARLKATLSGIVSGLPGNPWIALPAATVDVAVVLKVHALAAARVATIHDPNLLRDGGEAVRWELLVPVLGIERETVGIVPDEARGGAARGYVRKKGMKLFKKLVLKDFAKRVAKRAALGRSVPVLGAFIGGAWNFHEVARIRERTLAHFGPEAF